MKKEIRHEYWLRVYIWSLERKRISFANNMLAKTTLWKLVFCAAFLFRWLLFIYSWKMEVAVETPSAREAALEKEIIVLKAKVSEQDIQLREYEEALNNNNNVKGLNHVDLIASLKNDIQKYEEQLQNYKNKEIAYENTIRTMESDRENINKQIEEQNALIEQQKQQLEQSQKPVESNHDAMQAEFEESKKSLESLREYVLQKEKELEEKAKDNQTLTDKYEDLNILYEATMDILVTNERKIQETESELQKEKSKLKETENKLQELTDEMAKVRASFLGWIEFSFTSFCKTKKKFCIWISDKIEPRVFIKGM